MTETSMTLFEAGLPADLDDLFDNLENNVLPELPASDGLPFLKLDQDSGDWIFGVENEEVEPDSLWVVLVGSIRHGPFAWYNGNALNEMVPLSQKPKKIADLPKLDEVQTTGPGKGKPGAWANCAATELKCIKGAHAGTTVRYEGTNAGGSGMMHKLIEAIVSQRQRPGKYIFPVISFQATAKKGANKTRYPRYTIHDWLNAAGESRATAGAAKATVEDGSVVDAEVVEDDGAKPTEPAKSKRRKLEK